MKTSRYLNFILTIIALTMIALFLQQAGVIPPAYASSQTTEVDVNLKEIGGYSIYGGELKVSIDDDVRMRCIDCN